MNGLIISRWIGVAVMLIAEIVVWLNVKEIKKKDSKNVAAIYFLYIEAWMLAIFIALLMEKVTFAILL